jgi:hypothetical protein
MRKRPSSTLAAVIALHGGPSYADFEEVLLVLETLRVSPEDYDFGPAYEGARQRLADAKKTMQGFLKKL